MRVLVVISWVYGFHCLFSSLLRVNSFRIVSFILPFTTSLCNLWFRKTAAISLLFDRSSLKLVSILRLWIGTYLFCWECIVATIQDGGHLAFLNFEKRLQFLHYLTNQRHILVGILLFWLETHRRRRKIQVYNHNSRWPTLAAAAILNLKK